MTTLTISQIVPFRGPVGRVLIARLDQRHASSDGSAVPLKASDKVYERMAGFVRCLVDRRKPGKVRHTLTDLFGPRIFDLQLRLPPGGRQ